MSPWVKPVPLRKCKVKSHAIITFIGWKVKWKPDMKYTRINDLFNNSKPYLALDLNELCHTVLVQVSPIFVRIFCDLSWRAIFQRPVTWLSYCTCAVPIFCSSRKPARFCDGGKMVVWFFEFLWLLWILTSFEAGTTQSRTIRGF